MDFRLHLRPLWRSRRSWSAIGLLVVVALTASPGLAQNANPPAAAPLADETEARRTRHVADLIAQLGAEDFAARERAQAELGQLGLEVFDMLHAAQDHHDPEVALRSRFLVRSMSVRWFQDSDSPEIVKILKGYGDLAEPERKNRMDRLAGLENREGVPALCRLSRFETEHTLSKYAALKVLEQEPPADEAATSALQKTIRAIVGSSQRPAAAWMRLYAATLSDPAAALADWEKATQAERDTQTKNPSHTTREIVRDLYRYQVALLKRLDRQDEAIGVMRRTFDLLDGTPEQVTEIVDWMLQREAWAVVVEISGRFEGTFHDNPLLLYRLAHAHQKLGEAAKADEISSRALAFNPENHEQHLRIGHMLADVLGLHAWAEREYRQVIKTAGPGTVPEFEGRFYLSELLHDQAQELAAAETLKPVCDLMEDKEKGEAARDTCLQAQRNPPAVISRMNYLFACHFHEQKEHAQERAHLQTAIDADPQDADVLIAMYRLPQPDAAWQKQTREKITEIAAGFRADIDTAKQVVEGAGNDQGLAAYRHELGLACNQYAWLVGNTFGDYADAVKMSHLSLEMRPDYYGYLDTLGRCYYAKGDFENAIKYQAQALKKSPHSGVIRRQLEFFQKEQAAQAARAQKAAPQP